MKRDCLPYFDLVLNRVPATKSIPGKGLWSWLLRSELLESTRDSVNGRSIILAARLTCVLNVAKRVNRRHFGAGKVLRAFHRARAAPP
jgi:hypothetical protein